MYTQIVCNLGLITNIISRLHYNSQTYYKIRHDVLYMLSSKYRNGRDFKVIQNCLHEQKCGSKEIIEFIERSTGNSIKIG